jgi:Mg-chelatase subunit ChlD
MFTLTYRLFDTWGNPAAGRGFRVNTSLGENAVLTTNSTGVACLTYGPKDTTGIINFTATAVDNASVTIAQEVEFIHTDPVNMLLSASPQSMPSRDVHRNSVAELRAKVMDVKGNPVAGEEVTFTIDVGSIHVGGYTQTGAPYLQTVGQNEMSTTTGDDGYAIVWFHPGEFAGPEEEGWDAAAKGTATVQATWENSTLNRHVTQSLDLTWMNYPYLSVETSVSNETVAVNNTTDVTIRLKGDGWELRPDPIDVVLVIDRSSSMTGKDVKPSRIEAAKFAAQVFVGEMDQDRDRIGLVSYCAQTSRDLPLTDDYSRVNSTIRGLKTATGTGTRNGLYVAIQEMVANKSSNPDAVHAVILMSDGEYNYYGDPLARGTGTYDTMKTNWWTPSKDYTIFTDLEDQQSLADYARNNGIQLYMISFSNDIREGSHTWETMDILADETGGKHYHAATGDDLAEIYAEIAGELKTEAGVNTEITLDFGTIRVNDDDRNGRDVFSYVYENEVSTVIESWVENETGHHGIIPLTTINQTDDWNDNHTLQFDVGTVHLDQTWEATFRLRVLTDGNINIFGPGSTITFNDGAAELGLPDTFITAVPDLNNTGLGAATLTLSNPHYTCTEPVEEFLTAAWDLTYTGSTTATEFVEYSNDGGLSWVRFDTLTADGTVTGEISSLYVGALPPGEYQVRIRAFADDAPDAVLFFPSIRVGELSAAYIRLA